MIKGQNESADRSKSIRNHRDYLMAADSNQRLATDQQVYKLPAVSPTFVVDLSIVLPAMKVYVFAAVLLLVGVASCNSVEPEKRDLDDIYNVLLEVMGRIHEYVKKITDAVGEKIPEIKEKLKNAVEKLKDLLAQLKEHGKEHLSKVKGDIQKAVGDLLDAVNKGLDKNIGPLTNFNLSILKKMLEVVQEGLKHLGTYY